MQSLSVNILSEHRSSTLCRMEIGLYSVPKGFIHTSNPKFSSCLPMFSEKQLPSIIILSLYEMPTLQDPSATGVCNFSIVGSCLIAKIALKAQKCPFSCLGLSKFASKSTKMHCFVRPTEVCLLSLTDFIPD